LGQPQGHLARETGPSSAARGRTQGKQGKRTAAGPYLLPGETTQDFRPGGSALSIAPPLAATQDAVPGFSIHSLIEGRRNRQRNTRDANRATTRTWNDPDNPYGTWLREHEVPGEAAFKERFGYDARDLMNRASGTSIPYYAPSNLPSRAPAGYPAANRQGAPALPSYQPLAVTNA
jgi:hypothetical protein